MQLSKFIVSLRTLGRHNVVDAINWRMRNSFRSANQIRLFADWSWANINKTVSFFEYRATFKTAQWTKRCQNVLIRRPKLELHVVTFFMSTSFKIKPNKQPWVKPKGLVWFLNLIKDVVDCLNLIGSCF